MATRTRRHRRVRTPRVHGRTALEHGLRFNAVRRERADRAAERIR